MKYYLFSVLLFANVVLSGCASNSLFMDGRPLGENNRRISAGVSVRGILTDSAGVKEIARTDISFVPVDISYTAGVEENADIFLNYTAPLTLTIGGKVSSASEEDNCFYYAAVGLSIGFDFVSLLLNQDSSYVDHCTYFDLRLPVYQTFCISRYFSVSLIPDFIFRVDYRKGQILMGANANTRLGNRFGVFLEGSWNYNFRYKEPQIQLGGSLFFKLRS